MSKIMIIMVFGGLLMLCIGGQVISMNHPVTDHPLKQQYL